MPVMQVNAVSYGMGKRNFEAVNGVRAFWEESAVKNVPVLVALLTLTLRHRL
jgi:uncharacterized protein (DUF111 family)